MKNFNSLILVTAISAIFSNVSAQLPESQVKESPFTVEVTYLGDLVSNIKGGIQTGTAYMGLVDVGLNFETEKAGLWEGGEIFIHAQNTHGGYASGDLIGDLQVLSNIENGNFTYLYELWYKQSFGKLSVLAGINDLNAEFAGSEYGGLFLNSSFGIHASIALNVPVSIFPKTSLGLVFNYELSEVLVLRAAIYDGDPGSLEDDPHNLDWTINREDGFFMIGEVQYNLRRKENKNTIQKEEMIIGTYKIGSYYHSGSFENNLDGSIKGSNYGLYLLGDQVLIPRTAYSNKILAAFIQLGWCPTDRNLNNFYLGTGVNIRGLMFNRFQDILGVGIARANISRDLTGGDPDIIPGLLPMLNFETAVEFSYKVQVNDHLAIQPGLHYIINPGADMALDNALVPTIRVEVGF